MSEFESGRNMQTIVIAVVVISIIAVSGFVGLSMLGGTTDTTTTTTTTTPPAGLTLTVLTRHDVAIHNVFEPAFLASDLAIDANITNILWKTPQGQYWDDLIELGEIDICWGGGPTLFDQLIRQDYLFPLESDYMQTVAARVPTEIAGADMRRYDDGELMWIAAAISTFGFTVNHQFLDDYSLPTPTKWTDLASPIYASNLPTIPTIAMGNAPGTTSNTRIYEIMTQGLGWEEGWINMARMAGSANIYPGSVETQSASEYGDVGISMSIDFYGYLTQYNNPDCEYILPEGQTIVNGDPIAISATSSQKELSEIFLDFVLSDYGQSLWLTPAIRRIPILEGAFTQPAAVCAEDLYESFNNTKATTGIDFNDTLSLQINSAFIQYWEAVITEAHTELVDCWTLMIGAYYDGHITETELDDFAALMGAPVTVIDAKTALSEKFTQAFAISINDDMFGDTEYAGQMQNLWTTAAKAQYLSVYNMVLLEIP
ncbi:MAG: ABC transporter substrate-binding protein [Candidatus Thorarchaeota archaeon]